MRLRQAGDALLVRLLLLELLVAVRHELAADLDDEVVGELG